jgi:tetratricopeptide (TPR) repeat protein
MKRVDIAKNWTDGWAVTGVALICLLSPAMGQEPAVQPTEPSTASTEVTEVAEPQEIAEAPDAAATPEPAEPEADEPSTPQQSDADVLAQAPQMEVEQLQEMVQVFQRLGNTKMVEELSKVLLSKDPENAVGKGTETGETTTPLGMDDDDDDDDGPSAEDREVTRAENAAAAGRHEEAVGILRNLKSSNFKRTSFPYQQDLAYALLESGQVNAAADAFRELANDSAQTHEDRVDAEARLVDLRVQVESKRAMLLLAEDKNDEAVALAEGMVKAYPNNEAALGLNAEVLAKAGRNEEAAAFLKALKKGAGPGAFVFQQQLAYAVYESEGRTAAEPLFSELTKSAYPVDQRRDALERLRDFQIERLYEGGIKALQKGDAAGALRIGNRLMQANPTPGEAFELRALALQAQRKFADAAKVLEQFKSARFQDKPFPMAGELADCYAGMGDFVKAKKVYDQIINAPAADNAAEDIRDAKFGIAELAPITNPYIVAASEFFTEEEGEMFRADFEARSGMIGPHQFTIRAHRDEIDIADSVLKAGGYDRWDASATYTATLPNRYFADVTGGGSEDEFLYGVGVGRRAWGGIGWKLYYAANERATDSLGLEAVDGRQDAVHFDVNVPLKKNWAFDGRFNYRQVKVDGIDIGDGIQADMQFGKTLREASLAKNGIYIGYSGEFSDFTYGSPSVAEVRSITGEKNDIVVLPAIDPADLVGSLVEERINRHGFEVVVDRQITPRIAAAIVGGFGWEFEDEQFVYRAGLNLSYQLRENVFIQAALDYDSSGSSTNSGSEVILASVLLRIFF